MRGVTIIAAREIGERWHVLVAAVFAGMIPLVATFLAGLGTGPPSEVRWMFAASISVAFVLAVGWALVTGAISAELSAGRLGFYFARPLSGIAIWAGKLLGAFAVVVAGGFLVLLPTSLVCLATGEWPRGWPIDDVAVGVVLVAILVTAAAHPIAFLWRTHSPWLLADVTALALVTTAVTVSLAALVRTASAPAMTFALAATAVVFLLALLIAGGVQVVRGRCDLRLGHRTLSVTLWGIMAVAAVALASWTSWFVHVGPADLDEIWKIVAPRTGSWIAISGPAARRPGYEPTLLVDTETERSLVIVRRGLVGADILISDDGSRAAWLGIDVGIRRVDPILGVAELGQGEPTVTRTPLGGPPFSARFALAPSGDFLALAEADTVSVLSLPALGIVASAHLPDQASVRWPAILDDGSVVLLSLTRDTSTRSATLRVATFDTAVKQLTQCSSFALASHEKWTVAPRIDPASHRLLSVAPSDSSVALVLSDLLTGARVAVLEQADRQAQVVRSRFLADGRIVVAAHRDDGYRLLVFDRDGAPLLDHPLPATDSVRLGAEYLPNRVAVSLATRDEAGDTTRRALGIDLSSGETFLIGDHLEIAAPAFPWWSSNIAEVLDTGSVASRLFTGDTGTLYLLDTVTGELQPLSGS